MAIVIAGMGFFTDAYDFFVISLVVDIIGYKYYHGPPHRRVAVAISSIALCGAVPGHLIFGWLGDKMGRKRIYGITLVLMVVTSFASGLSFSKRVGKNVVVVLCFFRFWLGVSIGGDYPLSATIMSEYANKRRRGAFIATVFAMQGAITAILTYYWRMKMPETARYTALVAKDAQKAASDMSSVLNVEIAPENEAVNELYRQNQYGLFSAEFLHRHGIHLVGTSMWLNLFMKGIFTTVRLIPPLDMDHPFNRMIKTTALHTTIALCGTLPGYFFTVAFVDRIGRVRIQILGFAMMSVFMICLAAPYDRYWTQHKNKYGFAVIYGMTTFFANFGPNTTTFIIPAEIFPARLRSTCHGIAGAFGKIGAITGVFVFRYNENHVPSTLYGLVGCNIVGLLFTLLLPESKGKSLEEITGEFEQQPPQQHAVAFVSGEYFRAVPV
ncbi:hypothetical protein HU200_053864 [Digitaria exilis]|uniref:H(+)/Pi cotransporter n=1 Tax=Digitaria exilis TaxID=1010633 RepID=A0A835AGV3_9POAL|nr:hypothetical protein HU200_053864 [Digitaria exilis]